MLSAPLLPSLGGEHRYCVTMLPDPIEGDNVKDVERTEPL